MIKIFKYTLIIFLVSSALSILYIISAFFYDIEALKKNNPETTAFMRYRIKQWESNGLDKKLKYTWVNYYNISKNVRIAAIVSEDAKFWKHDGFDFDAIENAFKENVRSGRFKLGASTISQQVAKNLFLSPSKNPFRKLKEAVITYRMEQILSKRRILELYLNIAEMGDGIFGIEEASKYYFKKSAASLSAYEASKIIASLPNPIKYSPTGGSKFVANRSAIIYNRILKVQSYKK